MYNFSTMCYNIVKIMHKNSLLVSVIVSLFFISCSNENLVDLSAGSAENLKQVAARKNENIIWTSEIEAFRLSKNTSTSSSVATTIKLTPEIIAVSENNSSLYPVLEGFASLDTSAFSDSLLNYVQGLCKAVSAWSISAKDMAPCSDFSLTLFKYDVESLWHEYNGVDFPSEKLFEKWLIAEPFFEDDVVQVPVRFSNKKINMDVLFYIYGENNFVLDQIIIQKMEKR